VEPIAEITEYQGQTSEFVPDPGLMGDFVPEEMDQDDANGDSQNLMSGSVGRADSGSKIVGSAKAESLIVEQRPATCIQFPLRRVCIYLFLAMLFFALAWMHPRKKLI
jgi:hypothetical protein